MPVMEPDEPIRLRIEEEVDTTLRQIRKDSDGALEEAFLRKNLIVPRPIEMVSRAPEQDVVVRVWAVTNPTTGDGAVFIAYDQGRDEFCLGMEVMDRVVPPGQVLRRADLGKSTKPTGNFVYLGAYGSFLDALRSL